MTHSTPTPIGIILNLGSGKSNIYYFPHLPSYHPPHPCMTQPTTPHDTPHPTYLHPYITHPTLHDPFHPCMTHPTPPLHDPTPPLEKFWEEMGWISWGLSLYLPFGRQFGRQVLYKCKPLLYTCKLPLYCNPPVYLLYCQFITCNPPVYNL